MPTLRSVERAVANTEGFDVTIRHADGRDIRSDKTGVPGYPYRKGARNDFTVAEWRKQRFRICYPGYKVTVWLYDGTEAGGGMRLSTVRGSYLG
ncbi:MAG TPA: hypothetical protein VFB08_19365 [Burkholderiales bacterium]|nr:hypothetical protein [Burkholderiales bacterium]